MNQTVAWVGWCETCSPNASEALHAPLQVVTFVIRRLPTYLPTYLAKVIYPSSDISSLTDGKSSLWPPDQVKKRGPQSGPAQQARAPVSDFRSRFSVVPPASSAENEGLAGRCLQRAKKAPCLPVR